MVRVVNKRKREEDGYHLVVEREIEIKDRSRYIYRKRDIRDSKWYKRLVEINRETCLVRVE